MSINVTSHSRTFLSQVFDEPLDVFRHRIARYDVMRVLLQDGLRDMEALSGNISIHDGMAWQERAKNVASTFERLAIQLRNASEGRAESAVVFPSPTELVAEDNDDAKES